MLEAETLRAVIASALVARGSNAHTIDEHGNDDLALPRIAVLTAHASTRADALRALALACGLRVETCGACNGRGRHAYGREVEDGCDACECAGIVVVDPAEEVASLDDATRGALDDLARVRAERNAACAACTEATIGATHEAQQDRDAARRERDDARAALRANLRCDECDELATRAHADTARFGCEAHGVGEGWADTTHAAAVRAALR